MNSQYDVIVIGGGAAGLMCSIEAGKRGKKVLVLEHYHKIGEKIRISGGGRCNFTNLNTSSENFLSNNPSFCKSALKQYTCENFLDLLKRHEINFHEKKLGQLFCNHNSQDIIDMLINESRLANVKILTNVLINHVKHGFNISTNLGTFKCKSLVIATGGLSIPKIGATNFGYQVAKQFGLNVIETRPGLVPLTFTDIFLKYFSQLKGISIEALVFNKKQQFSEGLLFTHRGLSGPSILQISSYWHEGEEIIINLSSKNNVEKFLLCQKEKQNKQDIKNILCKILPRRLVLSICDIYGFSGRLIDLSNKQILLLGNIINNWAVKPSGSEGYKTAEVTLGGVDTNELSSKTMEAKSIKGLYFIGEVVDVTGQLGGYNFQWAWSSGYVAGQYV